MNKTFKDFLIDRCMEDTGALDDDLPDKFYSWVGTVTPQEMDRYKSEYNSSKLKDLSNRYFDAKQHTIDVKIACLENIIALSKELSK